jgi:hypothetical protein
MNKYKIGKYIVKADSICDAVTIVKTIKNSVKDKRVFGFGNFPYEYWLKNNDGGWFLAAFSKKKYERTELEALRKKYMLKNGKLPDYQEKFVDSIKDGKYVSELKPGDVITKKDGSKWEVALVRHTPFGIQVRMNSKTSPVKTEEITYRPTDMLVYDSVKDARTISPWALSPGKRILSEDGDKATVVSVKGDRRNGYDVVVKFDDGSTDKWYYMPDDVITVIDSGKKIGTMTDTVEKTGDSFQKDSLTVRDVIQSLINEETSAISSYNVALETLKDHIPAEAYEAIKAIRDDEQRHVENLYAVLNGNVTQKNLEN